MATWYIGADVDSKMTELAIDNGRGVVRRHRVPTTIPELKGVLAGIGGTKRLTFEEGPMAQWLYRNLRDAVDELVVCDPRRNRLISDDGDKADAVDAAKLAELLRGGYLRAVYHSPDDQQVVLKQWVSLYHDRVHDAVRQINKIRARCRMHGMRPPRGALRNESTWERWLSEIKLHPLAGQLRVLRVGLEANRRQARMARQMLGRLGQRYAVLRAWEMVPGIGPIRAVTLLAYLDTPWRFASAKKLWKYCGVGLQRKTSGSDKEGRPKPGMVKLAYRVNRRLKEAVAGAARSAINQQHNVFADYYGRLLQKGVYEANAWHAVSRKLLTVMWGMWKTGSRFDPACVCGRKAITTKAVVQEQP